MRLTLATWDHDRCMPLHEGRVSIPGVEFESHILPTGKLFPIAVQEARDIALQDLREVWLGSANRLSLPWLNEAMEKTMSAMGPDYWPYGYAQNQKELEAACRYSIEQYLAGRLVAPEELFPPCVIDVV